MENNKEDLLNSVVEAFKELPEVYSISVFGSTKDKSADKYSDIDLMVCSTDMVQTSLSFRNAIEKISPIVGYSPFFDERPNIISQIIYLKNFEAFKKIDLTIVPYIGYMAEFNPEITTIFEKDVPVKDSSTILPAITIQTETTSMWFAKYLGFLVGFYKTWNRKSFDYYRYWTVIKDLSLVLQYEDLFGFQENLNKTRLESHELKLLYKTLDANQKSKFDEILPLNGELNIFKSFKVAANLFIDLATKKANYLNRNIDQDFVEYVRAFLNSN